MNKYRHDLYLYGIDKLLIQLSIAEKIEDYETAKEIKDAIDYHNDLVNDTLPTHLDRDLNIDL